MRRRGLFWRVYLNGLLLLGIVTLALAVASVLFGRPRPWGPYAAERLAEQLAARHAELRGDSSVLARDLAHEYRWFGVDLSVYGTDGALLVTNVQPPVPPPPDAGAAGPQRGRHLGVRRGRAVVPVERNGERIGYAVLRTRSVAPHVLHVVKVSATILAFLALGSIPLARQITSPLEQLTRAVERFGGGDLGARSGMTRRDEVGDLAHAFDTMAARLERLVRAEKEFLANVSHELRTPLARVRVALEIAAEGDEAKARAKLEEIAADLTELERLVGDILTAARLDLASGRTGSTVAPLRLEPVAADELVRQIGARFRADHPDRRLDVEVETPLPVLSADPALLRRALDNLLDNARKYADADQPIVLVAREAAPGAADRRPTEAPRGAAGPVPDGPAHRRPVHGGPRTARAVEIEVRDRGIGIDPADQARLFTPFFRADRSRARDTGGVGLGLVLARRIVEAHGGTIEVDSRPGQGTTFRVRIPVVAG